MAGIRFAARRQAFSGGRRFFGCFGCCVTRPFFALQKTGTQTVLAESSETPEKPKRDPMVTEGLPARGEPDIEREIGWAMRYLSHRVSGIDGDCLMSGARRVVGTKVAPFEFGERFRDHQVAFKFFCLGGVLCEYCSSPENCVAILVELRSSRRGGKTCGRRGTSPQTRMARSPTTTISTKSEPNNEN
jgi:hypothetical protein